MKRPKNSPRKSSLQVRLTDPGGKRRYCQPVFTKNSRTPKPGRAILDGKEVSCPDAVFVLRYPTFDGGRAWETVGRSPDRAAAAKQDRDYILLREDRGDIVPRLSPKKAIKPTHDPKRVLLESKADEWLNQAKLGDRSRYIYGLSMELFRASCPKTYLDEITTSDVQHFANKLKDAGAGARTVHNHVAHLRTFFRFAGMANVIKGSDVPKYTEKKVSAYTEVEVARMRDVSNHDERLWLDFMIATGVREQEAMFCYYDDIDFDSCILHVKEKCEFRFTIKDKKERKIPVARAIVDRIAEQRKRSSHRLVFCTDTGKTNGHMLTRIKGLYMRAGLNCGHCLTKPRSGGEPWSCAKHPCCAKSNLHKTRKTYATMLSWAGVPLIEIRDLLGHTDIETTMSTSKVRTSPHLRSRRSCRRVSPGSPPRHPHPRY